MLASCSVSASPPVQKTLKETLKIDHKTTHTFYVWFAADVRLKRKDEIQLQGDSMDVSQIMPLGPVT